MMDELADTRFSVLLSDRTARIIDRRVAQRELNGALDRVLAAPGFQYLEESSGTNALATAYELAKPIAVSGDEHYLESLRQFCCFGAPIVHPIVRRVVGVLDITGPVQQSTTLLGPFLMRAVHDIEQRLLEGARVTEQRLLAAFQTHTRNTHQPVLVYGDNVLLSNPAAADLLRAGDYAELRMVAAAVHPRATVRRQLALASGASVLVTASAVPDTAGGVVFDIVPAESTLPPPVAAVSAPVVHRRQLVIGEPGTGRTTTAREIAGPNAAYFTAVDEDPEGRWVLSVRQALVDSPPVVIDDIHALSPRSVAVLAAAVGTAPGDVVMATSPLSDECTEHAALAAEALHRRELRPLRAHRQGFHTLVSDVLDRLKPGAGKGIAPSALNALASHTWPGNFRELESVLAYACSRAPVGDISERHLPEVYRSRSNRPLTLLENAERDAIVAALRNSDGNRTAAAAELGIGRTTLYARLRRYRIGG
ncbi:sigma-54-dependent Fis family transcriptional regulator [Nocardia rhizosphaerihabitans]|uniref:sigma-54-dependent Fis family transcriptional regulator n=1 Tax=Nocardia rhizosphaerihabitans TaxID=1691570 RepID=UPI00366B349B